MMEEKKKLPLGGPTSRANSAPAAQFKHRRLEVWQLGRELVKQLVLAEDLGYVKDSTKAHSCVEDLSIRINHLISHIRSGG